tara:strand:+ start:109 stop:342 length:234 start_codon:yes stop_codon:yes gene_type:complete
MDTRGNKRSSTSPPWGAATPAWLRKEIGTNASLRKAIDDCLSEQGCPDDMDMFPDAFEILSLTSPVEIDELVAQGRT